MSTRQGNRPGRGCVVDHRSAPLSSEFGMKMLRDKFEDDADAILERLGTYSRGPRKGLPRGYVHWDRVVEGGFDYASRRVRYPGSDRWRVLDGVDHEYSADVSDAIRAERERVAREVEESAYENASPRGKLVIKALRARASAHRDLAHGDRYDFHYNMKRARGYIRQARHN